MSVLRLVEVVFGRVLIGALLVVLFVAGQP